MSSGKWIKIDQNEDLPDGIWLVRLEDGKKEFQVAYSQHPNNILIIGHAFSFDLPRIVEYYSIQVDQLGRS